MINHDKKYTSSNLTKVLTLGLKQYGYKIDGGTLTKTGLAPKHIPIDSINTISFELRATGESTSFYYILLDKQGKEIKLSYSTLDGKEYQDMFRDLLSINPKIKLTSEMQTFLNSEITNNNLKFDFNVYKGEFFKRNRELPQKQPSLDAFVGLTIVFIFLSIPFVFYLVGNKLLIDIFSTNYDSYRLWAIVISGIAFTITLANLFISLVSMYLGHKLTYITLVIALIGLYIGFKV